jgi:hypothetical protein
MLKRMLQLNKYYLNITNVSVNALALKYAK